MDQYFIKKKLEAKIVQIFFFYKNNNTIGNFPYKGSLKQDVL